MDVLDLSRWQFGRQTGENFFHIPLALEIQGIVTTVHGSY
jgi:hypothetical protein